MNAKEYLEENGSYIIDTIAMRKFGMNVIRLMEEYAKLKLEEQETIIYLKNNTDKPIEIPFPFKIEHKKESKT